MRVERVRAALIVNSRRSLALFVDFADFSPALFPFNYARCISSIFQTAFQPSRELEIKVPTARL